MSKSEVAQLRQRIENEIAAMRLLMHGPAITGRHDLINRRERNMHAYHQQHQELVGEQEAIAFLLQAHQQIEGDESCTN